MELTIEAYKPNTIIEVDAKIIDSTTDLRNLVYWKGQLFAGKRTQDAAKIQRIFV